MHGMGVGGRGFDGLGPSPAEEDGDPETCPAPARHLSLQGKADLTSAELAGLPTDELLEVAERYPEAVARLPLERLAELGNARPEILDRIYHSRAASVPAQVPSGFTTGTHVYVPGSGVDLPFLVRQGVSRWKGKEWKPASGEMVDRVAWLPDSKAKAYIGDINAAIRRAAGGNTDATAPVNRDGRKALITDYTQASQAFGVKLRWIDEFRELPNGTLLGVSYWMDGAEPKKWSYVLLDFAE